MGLLFLLRKGNVILKNLGNLQKSTLSTKHVHTHGITQIQTHILLLRPSKSKVIFHTLGTDLKGSENL